jgi:hypothetical protein
MPPKWGTRETHGAGWRLTRAAEFVCRLLVRRADETLAISKLRQSLRKPNVAETQPLR